MIYGNGRRFWWEGRVHNGKAQHTQGTGYTSCRMEILPQLFTISFFVSLRLRIEEKRK